MHPQRPPSIKPCDRSPSQDLKLIAGGSPPASRCGQNSKNQQTRRVEKVLLRANGQTHRCMHLCVFPLNHECKLNVCNKMGCAQMCLLVHSAHNTLRSISSPFSLDRTAKRVAMIVLLCKSQAFSCKDTASISKGPSLHAPTSFHLHCA